MDYMRMTLVLTVDEMQELRKLASKNLRRPRDQVRYMVQVATGLAPDKNVMIPSSKVFATLKD